MRLAWPRDDRRNIVVRCLLVPLAIVILPLEIGYWSAQDDRRGQSAASLMLATALITWFVLSILGALASFAFRLVMCACPA